MFLQVYVPFVQTHRSVSFQICMLHRKHVFNIVFLQIRVKDMKEHDISSFLNVFFKILQYYMHSDIVKMFKSSTIKLCLAYHMEIHYQRSCNISINMSMSFQTYGFMEMLALKHSYWYQIPKQNCGVFLRRNISIKNKHVRFNIFHAKMAKIVIQTK